MSKTFTKLDMKIKTNNPQASFDVVKLICPNISRNLVINYQLLIDKLILNEGKKQAVVVLKGYYGIATRVAMHKTFVPISFRKSDSSGFPAALMPFKELLLSSNSRDKQAALTILRSYVQIYLSPDDNTQSITTPGVEIDRISWFNEWETFITHWVKKFNFPCPNWKQGQLRPTTKSGPNGPALLWSHIDALALKSDKLLWDAFVEYNEVFDQVDLTNYVLRLFDCNLELNTKSYKHSKLSFLSEGGGKTRVVAIGDYWSQEALKGLHEFLYSCLRNLRTDGTFDQGRIARITREATKKGLPVYCYDLTAATDRFPVSLLETMMSKLFNPRASKAWKTLLSDRRFSFCNKIVTYGAGTPMGLLTSWASFALCHHALIEFAAKQCGFNHFESYVLLGDDVAIFNTKVATNYKLLLADLGVSISLSKSVISYGRDHSAAEIAKRLFYRGEEISPIPFDIIQKARSDVLVFPMLIRTIIDRDVGLTPIHAGSLMQKWYSNHLAFQPLLTVPIGLPGYIKYPDIPQPHLSFPIRDSRQVGQYEVTNVIQTVTFLDAWADFTLEEIKKETVRQRLKTLTEKLIFMQGIYNRLAPGRINLRPSQAVGQFLANKGVPIPKSVLHATSVLDASGEITFPLMYVLSKEVMELMFLEDRLEDADPEIEGSLSLKEYVPDITVQKYFNTYEEIRQKRTSSIMLETLRHLRLNKATNDIIVSHPG